ncbi:cell wall-binding repeat-containing protein [Bacillus salacetis]|uniref:RCC1 domain-containing protein n=1 Tax=Bacillus salacetis TaxID=2315464 RepID=UPI003B9E4AEC
MKRSSKILSCFLMFLLLFQFFPQPQSQAAETVLPNVEGGFSHSIALKSDGSILGWGSGKEGQLGAATASIENQPIQTFKEDGEVIFGFTAIQPSKGNNHTYALHKDGTVWTWGSFNIYGSFTTDWGLYWKPVQIPTATGAPLQDVVQISAGMTHLIALKADGTVWTWGFNLKGQLGDGTFENRSTAVQVKHDNGTPLTNIISVSAGDQHSMALTADGNVWTWGGNDHGQLGNNTKTNSPFPIKVNDQSGEILSGITYIAGGDKASFAISEDKTVLGWGFNEYGQLGDGSKVSRHFPAPVKNADGTDFTDAKSLSIGGSFVIALSEEGNVYSWGRNQLGQLGNGKIEVANTVPEPIMLTDNTNLAGVVSIGTGWHHAFAVRKNGTVLAWGLNLESKLGLDVERNQLTPAQKKNLDGTPFTLTSNTDFQAPGEVASLSSVKKDKEIQFTWAQPHDIDFSHVNVYKSGKKIKEVTESLFTDTNVTEGTHRYIFTTEDQTGNESAGISIDVSVTIPVPAAPAVLPITDQDTQLSGTAEPFATITVKKDTHLLTSGKASDSGYFALPIARQAAGTVLTVIVENSYGKTSDPATVEVADKTVPVWLEAAMTADQITHNSLILKWAPGSDNVGIAEYQIYQNGTLIGSVGKETNFTVTGLNPGTNYTFKVEAADAEGNKSVPLSKQVKTKIEVSRIFGADRFLTAKAISENGWASADTVFIATAYDFPDALAGAPLAYQYDAPILLAGKKDLTAETKDEIRRLGAKKAVILGGPAAVSTEVEASISRMGLTVERISGQNRFETAAKIAKRLGSSKKAVIAYGYNFPDALSMASYAAQNGYPILLTGKDSILPAPTETALASISETLVVGGESVISSKVIGQLPRPARISGENRFATSAAIASAYYADSKTALLANGYGFADALTGSVLAAKQNAPLLLVRQDRIPDEISTFIQQSSLGSFRILGGEAAISTDVMP